jgi:putative ubiquitin-RnfH superfamily antitoxin RatB of RatAB toxin-antitoxin module
MADRRAAPEPPARDRLRIEVVYALPQCAIETVLEMPVGATVADALAAAGAEPSFREIDLARAAVGIFGVTVRRDRVLERGDRVEIYRPLAADPKAARRARVKEARVRRG